MQRCVFLLTFGRLFLTRKMYCLAFKNDKSYFDYGGDCLKQIVDKDKNFSIVVLELLFQKQAPLNTLGE